MRFSRDHRPGIIVFSVEIWKRYYWGIYLFQGVRREGCVDCAMFLYCVALGGDGLRLWENQRTLSSYSVYLFVRTITSERLNVRRSNLAVRYIAQKSRQTLKVKLKGQRFRSLGTKNEKTAKSYPLTMHSRACTVARSYAPSSNRRYHCVADRE